MTQNSTETETYHRDVRNELENQKNSVDAQTFFFSDNSIECERRIVRYGSLFEKPVT